MERILLEQLKNLTMICGLDNTNITKLNYLIFIMVPKLNK